MIQEGDSEDMEGGDEEENDKLKSIPLDMLGSDLRPKTTVLTTEEPKKKIMNKKSVTKYYEEDSW